MFQSSLAHSRTPVGNLRNESSKILSPVPPVQSVGVVTVGESSTINGDVGAVNDTLSLYFDKESVERASRGAAIAAANAASAISNEAVRMGSGHWLLQTQGIAAFVWLCLNPAVVRQLQTSSRGLSNSQGVGLRHVPDLAPGPPPGPFAAEGDGWAGYGRLESFNKTIIRLRLSLAFALICVLLLGDVLLFWWEQVV